MLDKLSDNAKALLFVARTVDDLIRWGYINGKVSLTETGTSVGDQLVEPPQISFDDFVQILTALGIRLAPAEYKPLWTLYNEYAAKRIPEQQCTDSETN